MNLGGGGDTTQPIQHPLQVGSFSSSTEGLGGGDDTIEFPRPNLVHPPSLSGVLASAGATPLASLGAISQTKRKMDFPRQG